jgi:hypothetical protein
LRRYWNRFRYEELPGVINITNTPTSISIYLISCPTTFRRLLSSGERLELLIIYRLTFLSHILANRTFFGSGGQPLLGLGAPGGHPTKIQCSPPQENFSTSDASTFRGMIHISLYASIYKIAETTSKVLKSKYHSFFHWISTFTPPVTLC